ncbi:MAG: hypothetical protein ACI4RB_03715 [Acutalibacteraceae bacterium]
MNDEKPKGFESVTVFVLASDETDLLRCTIEKIIKNCSGNELEKIVVVLKSADCPSAAQMKRIIAENGGEKITPYVQKSDSLIKCFAELPPLAQSSHFVIMGADLEMNPDSIKDFIREARLHPDSIICASKWKKGSVVEGYGAFHKLCSVTFNKVIALLYNKKASDIFSSFQIYPTKLYYDMNFKNPDTFLYEYTLKPLRAGADYIEINTVYHNRSSGKSHFNFGVLARVAAAFFLTAVKIRFMPAERDLYEKNQQSDR